MTDSQPVSGATQSPVTRYYVLDGIRGVAAMLVVLYHYLGPTDYPFMGNAPVALDMFFILSGFVIYHSYASKLRNGMTSGAYINARIGRLAPTVIIGVLFGLFAVLTDPTQRFDGVRLVLVHLGHMFFLPDFIGYSIPAVEWGGTAQNFPSNGPLWSIFYEFVGSVCFIWLVRLPKWALVVGSAVSFALLVLGCYELAIRTGVPIKPDIGWTQDTLLLGFARLFSPFMAGMAIYAFTQNLPPPKPQKSLLPAIGVYAATVAMMWFPFTLGGFYPFIAISVLSALLVYVGSRTTPTARWFNASADWLGQVSFPVYVVHVPIHWMVDTFCEGWRWRDQIMLSFFLTIVVSILVLEGLNRIRARQRLSKLLRPITG